MLSYRTPAVMAGKDPLNSVSLCLPPAQLTAPGDTCPGVGPGAAVAVLGIPGRLLIRGIVPVMPPCRHDVTAQLALHKERGSKRTPGSAEIGICDAVSRGEPAAVENITVLIAFNG